MVFSWVLFRAETIEGALIFYQSMLGISEINAKLNEEINLLFLSICLVCVYFSKYKRAYSKAGSKS